MTYRLDTTLVNGRFGDPVVYVDLVFGKRALLFDVGDIRKLSRSQIRKVTDLFMSHTHMDHFSDFDNLLRILLRRNQTVRVYGPQGIIEKVAHKFGAYSWNLAEEGAEGVSFEVMEVLSESRARTTVFRFADRFGGTPPQEVKLAGGTIHEDHDVVFKAAVLDHKLKCLGFAVQATCHLNVWKSKLEKLEIPGGPWINRLKDAIREGKAPTTRIRIPAGQGKYAYKTLGELEHVVVRETPGEKIGYIVDVIGSSENCRKIEALIKDADLLFIEASFLEKDKKEAKARYHLTAKEAGTLGRKAGVKTIEPFHISLRYEEEEERVVKELNGAFTGLSAQEQ